MKTIVRSFVALLAVTAAFASATTPFQAVKPRPNTYPVPVCPPNDPNACGIGQGR